MRYLTKKQKQLLLATNAQYVTAPLLQQLEKLNDYETLTQDAKRFLQDKNSHQIQRHFHQALNSNQARLDKEDWWIKWR